MYRLLHQNGRLYQLELVIGQGNRVWVASTQPGGCCDFGSETVMTRRSLEWDAKHNKERFDQQKGIAQPLRDHTAQKRVH